MPRKKTRAPSPPVAPVPVNRRAGSKLGALIGLLQQEDGATLEQMTAATGWQTHSVRGALAGALKKRGHVVTSVKTGAVRIYSLPTQVEVQP